MRPSLPHPWENIWDCCHQYSRVLLTQLANGIFLSFQTGTLTEGNLDLAGVCETKKANFQETQADPTLLALDSRLVQAMATCHSLIKLKGELTGNPLDVKLFDAIEWVSETHFRS